MTTAVCLAGYGTVVAILAPWLLTPRMTGLAPRLGIAGWLLAVATTMLSWAAALVHLASEGAGSARMLAAAVLGLLLARLLWGLWDGGTSTRSRRRRQRDGLAVLGRPDPDLGMLVVDSPTAVAYCLPGRPAVVVVTTAARAALTRRQLRAVLAHERAHLRGRHSIVLAAVYGLARALPRPALFATAAAQIAMLLEMRADDVAARVHGRRTVAAALSAMRPTRVPAAALGATGPGVLARAARLCLVEPPARRRRSRLMLVAVVAALAVGPYLAAVAPVCPHPLW